MQPKQDRVCNGAWSTERNDIIFFDNIVDIDGMGRIFRLPRQHLIDIGSQFDQSDTDIIIPIVLAPDTSLYGSVFAVLVSKITNWNESGYE